MDKYDVCVVGAGIAGSALAASLQGHNLRIALLEANPINVDWQVDSEGAAGFDARVSAITPASQSFLSEIGVWEPVVSERACSYSNMQVWDGEGTGSINFSAREVGAQQLGFIVENRVLTRALLRALINAEEVDILERTRVEAIAMDSSPSLLLEGGTALHCELVVAADGALSRLRELGQFKTREWDYGHHALACTVETRLPHADTAYQRFISSGPLAFLPLPVTGNRHFCSIVWSMDSKQAPEILALDDDEFLIRLEGAFEGKLGALLSCSPRIAFPLRQRHAVDYVQAGMALVGDAAHTIHPLAGQGINLGLQDVRTLSRELLAAWQSGRDIGSLAVLRRYQRQRKGDNLLMMAAMDGFKHLFGHSALPLRLLRGAGMRLANRAGPVKQQIMRRAMGID